MPAYTPEAQELLQGKLSEAIDIYNGFHAGRYEREILGLRDTLVALAGDDDAALESEAAIEVKIRPELLGLLIASTKQLGDICMRIGQLNKTGRLFVTNGKAHG